MDTFTIKPLVLVLVLGLILAGLSVNFTGVGEDEPDIVVPRDYETIQAAIDAASPGDTIEVRAGTYKENLVIGKSVTLVGTGQDETTLKPGANGKPIVKIEGETAISVTIKNLTVAEGNWGITGAGSTVVTIENCRVHDNAIVGITFADSSQGTIRESQIDHNGTAIHLRDSSQAKILNNQINENQEAIWLIDSSNATSVKGNEIHHNKGTAIEIINFAQATIENNDIMGSGSYGIEVWYSAQADIEGNEIYSNEFHGILVEDEAKATIKENWIFRNDESGIWIQDDAEATMTKNLVRDNGYYGIYAKFYSNIVSCSGNTVSGNRGGNYCGDARGRCH